MKLVSLALVASLLAAAPAMAENQDWQILFDGKSTSQWRGFKQEDFPSGGWEVKKGVLTSIAGGDRVDIVTREKFADFELELEYRVEPKGNSGVFFRVSEEPARIWHFSPEIQILDDTPNTNPLHATGALYDLLPARNKHLRPPLAFNTLRIIARGNNIEHWLNGRRVLSYDLDSEDVRALIAKSKFAEFAQFGNIREGFIGLQHHGDSVGFRNIRIRRLDSASAD